MADMCKLQKTLDVEKEMIAKKLEESKQKQIKLKQSFNQFLT